MTFFIKLSPIPEHVTIDELRRFINSISSRSNLVNDRLIQRPEHIKLITNQSQQSTISRNTIPQTNYCILTYDVSEKSIKEVNNDDDIDDNESSWISKSVLNQFKNFNSQKLSIEPTYPPIQSSLVLPHSYSFRSLLEQQAQNQRHKRPHSSLESTIRKRNKKN
ncbi:expressed protein [Phakopsora pachyrhizi]|uniref:Expressed protein n=1 Tax=Phakopsora pachyrhizi TaxID=170000 RepID=A0AAV0B3F9_PHAPC|nr:expressed protein [Phakopsora pachyrhizi]